MFRSAFTAAGTFTYDERLVVFNVRYEVRVQPDEPGLDGADPSDVVIAEAVERARRWLDAAGIGHKHLRATATDMSSMWR